MVTKKEKEKPEFKSNKWIKFNYGEFVCYGRTYMKDGETNNSIQLIAAVQQTGATSHFRYDNELITNIKYLK